MTKKILFSSLLLSLPLFAVENMNDFSKHSYGKNNFTLNLIPGSSGATKNGTSYIDPMNTFGLELHSKASLKQYHYKVGEIFWEGGGKIYLLKDKDGTEYVYSSLEVDFGYTTNLSIFTFGTDIGISGDWTNTTLLNEDKDLLDNNVNTDNTNNEVYLYGEGFIGMDILEKWSLGGVLRYSAFRDNGENYSKYKISMPIMYKNTLNSAVTFTPSYEKNKMTNIETYQLTIGFSWLYQ